MAKQPPTLIKVCGITREEDAAAALSCGVDALGLNFYPDSPRHVSPGRAAEIVRSIADKALKVGLFVDADAATVRDVLGSVPLDILQFHGGESAEYCRQFNRAWWKAIRVKEGMDIRAAVDEFPDAAGILLDAWHPDLLGGTGSVFDWSVLDGWKGGQHLILAGGLNPENVAEAVSRVRPWAVDVSSGVELAPGIKSTELMRQFVKEVRRV